MLFQYAWNIQSLKSRENHFSLSLTLNITINITIKPNVHDVVNIQRACC